MHVAWKASNTVNLELRERQLYAEEERKIQANIKGQCVRPDLE